MGRKYRFPRGYLYQSRRIVGQGDEVTPEEFGRALCKAMVRENAIEEVVTEDTPNATDAAMDLARENDLSLSDIDGTGDEGRVLKGDVEDYLSELDSE